MQKSYEKNISERLDKWRHRIEYLTLKYLVYHRSFIHGFYDETSCEQPELKLYLIFHDLPSSNH